MPISLRKKRTGMVTPAYRPRVETNAASMGNSEKALLRAMSSRMLTHTTNSAMLTHSISSFADMKNPQARILLGREGFLNLNFAYLHESCSSPLKVVGWV